MARYDTQAFRVKIYRRVADGSGADAGETDSLTARFRVTLPDRPGSLAAFAAAIAEADGNIAFFYYDRSLDSNRVAAEVHLQSQERLDSLLAVLNSAAGFIPEAASSAANDVQITTVESVLQLTVRFENRPGALAGFARMAAAHGANVIYMLYGEDIDPRSARIAMATRDPAEIDALLRTLNEQGYHYRVAYRGADEQAVAQVIGLKLVEKFFLRLKRLMPESTLDELRGLVRSSRELEEDLIRFSTEAGNHLEAGDVFEKVLTLASRSRSWTGPRFRCREMEFLTFPGGVELHGFRLPTSENVYIFRYKDELAMIDAGHGVYFADFTALLQQRGMDPGRIARIFVTHPDTDHAGMSGYFEETFGTQVFLHPGSDDVVRNQNRAWGASGGLLNLNKYYTRLSSRFTECRFPSRPSRFPTTALSMSGGFPVIDRFHIGPLEFEVLESRGGHTAGLVFFLNPEHGLLFTSDFLINIPSLHPEEKEHLGIYRYLLTNPNRDSALYRDEAAALSELALSLNNAGKHRATIFPGHGNYYRAEDLRKL